ncbi:AarF/ABC1/UbiB kinase family protein [Synechococcus sp. Nb3U1]|uniref:ABC1 kinase family protein n=1 Tax=Synechococcus sp. Nb3U1 TaxID=1914529 RepID=UPI001F28623A|nr:AarF/ABC1/UbiB kinase family protein [Synechococcus sp. Nb3U1]MCF2971776.1 AarF/ABC1/UbiB kinase family protein [Synechococcus sp. Nb3U1]
MGATPSTPIATQHSLVSAAAGSLVPSTSPGSRSQPVPSEPALRYDPEQLAKQYRGRWDLVLRRLFQLVSPFVGLLAWIFWDRWRGVELKNRPKHAARLRKILTELGPTAIKIGQALSTRPDLVSPLFLEELAKLQDELPPFDNQIAFDLIESEIGLPVDKIYRQITPNPIAAASLGQVYQAYLHTGEKVAVKVQRPDLVGRISLDMYIIRGLAVWAKQTFRRIRSDLVGIVEEFAARLYEEMDYTQEGHNAERFLQLYRHPSIYAPKIYWDYTRTKVLTMEWIDGTKLTQLDKITAAGLDGRHLIEIGVNCSLKQLLENGFFHADPHPGNLLAMADGRLAYIDFGMMSTIQPHQRYGLIKAIVHLVNRDFVGLAQDYVDLEFLSPDTDLTPIIPALEAVFAEAMGSSVAQMNFKSMTDKLSGVMYDFPFRVPAYYALIIRSLLTLEGIAISLDPNFKVLSVAYPYVAQRLLSDPAPELRVSLRELLFNQGQFRWNRLENLLRNATNSEDFDLQGSLEKALDFIFSERGAFLRERLVDAIFSSPGSQTGSPAQPTSDTMEHLQRLWELLSGNPTFQPMQLFPVVAKVATKPEAQQLGRQLASRWLQRSAARLIRDLLLPDAEEPSSTHSRNGIPGPTSGGQRATTPRLPLSA